jgi:hypothetical protein
MPKFNHLFDVAFTVISDKEDGCEVPSTELIKALKARIASLEAMTDEGEKLETFGLYDTYEIEDVI